jgi:hypothetical protein
MPISPQLLKHFAAATVAITACIALFADGSATEAVVEQVKANEVKKAEVDMMGSRKVAGQKLQVRSTSSSVPVEDDGPSGDAIVTSTAGSGPLLPPVPGNGNFQQYRQGQAVPMPPGAPSADGAPPRPAPGTAPRRQTRPAPGTSPDPEQLEKIREAARQRAGSSSAD